MAETLFGTAITFMAAMDKSIAQTNPPAIEYARSTRVNKRSREEQRQQHSQEPPSKRFRATTPPPEEEEEEKQKTEEKAGGDATSTPAAAAAAETEEHSHLVSKEDLPAAECPQVVPNYPVSIYGSDSSTRRWSINLIMAMCHALNLEACTASFAALLFDRYMSVPPKQTQPKKYTPDAAFLTAMVITNMAGKLCDVDMGYCGSKEVLMLMHSMHGPSLLSDFRRCVNNLEIRIMEDLKSRPLAVPTALQYISTSTSWNTADETKWLQAVFLSDLMAAATISTSFKQHEIAEAIRRIVTDNPAHDVEKGGEAAEKRLVQATEYIKQLIRPYRVCASVERPYDYPSYSGLWLRHRRNPAISDLIARLSSQ